MGVERRDDLYRRHRLAAGLRLICAASVLTLATAVFWEPLRLILGPKVTPVVQGLGLPKLFRPRVAPGFVLQIGSRPSGATVLVDDTERGATPAFLNVVCSDGQGVTLTVRKPGFVEFRQTIPCREGQRAVATIQLQPAGRR